MIDLTAEGTEDTEKKRDDFDTNGFDIQSVGFRSSTQPTLSTVNSQPNDCVHPEPFDYAQDKLRRRAQGGAVNSQQLFRYIRYRIRYRTSFSKIMSSEFRIPSLVKNSNLKTQNSKFSQTKKLIDSVDRQTQLNVSKRYQLPTPARNHRLDIDISQRNALWRGSRHWHIASHTQIIGRIASSHLLFLRNKTANS